MTTPDDDTPDLVGASLSGGWRIDRHVAEGGMGQVYEATGPAPEYARAAVKVLHTSLMARKEVAFRFRREAEILEALDSPHVPRLLGRGRDPKGRPFFVVEFVEGEELSSVIRAHGRLEPEAAVVVAVQICRALETAHAAGIVHRDMKSENVMVSGSLDAPFVWVLDFSVSKTEDLQFTQAGTVLGTPAYMPPEQARGLSVGTRADVYGVGAILFDMLAGRPPFDGTEPGRILMALLTQDPPRLRELSPEVPEAIEAIVMRALAKSPEARQETVAELAASLEAALPRASLAPVKPVSLRPAPANLALEPPDAAAPPARISPASLAPSGFRARLAAALVAAAAAAVAILLFANGRLWAGVGALAIAVLTVSLVAAGRRLGAPES